MIKSIMRRFKEVTEEILFCLRRMPMLEYEKKLKDYMINNSVAADHLHFDKICHSVQEAADAAGATPDDLVKNICMVDDKGNLIVAIVKGEDRVSTSRVGKALKIERPRIATEEEILEKTGFPCGGVPSFGYHATFIVDPRVMEKEYVYSGGGSEYSLVRMSSQELTRVNSAIITRVRK